LEMFVVLAIGELSLMLENMLGSIFTCATQQVETNNCDILTTPHKNHHFS
jgi:hypothetical protein